MQESDKKQGSKKSIVVSLSLMSWLTLLFYDNHKETGEEQNISIFVS